MVEIFVLAVWHKKQKMLGKIFMNKKRSEKKYIQMCKLIDSKFEKLSFKGFENYLYLYQGKVLKLYKWFAFKMLTSKEEKDRRLNEKYILNIYSPKLDSIVVGLKEDGSVDIDISNKKFFCYGILMIKGEPFLEKYLKCTVKQKIYWAKRIGKSLAQYHQDKNTLTIHGKFLINYLIEVCHLIKKNNRYKKIIPQRTMNILSFEKKSKILDMNIKTPVIHGDLNLSNIVLFEDKIQFIDPGYALPWGIGMKKIEELTFDICWDLALMANSFKWYSNQSYLKIFLNSYFIEKNWTDKYLKSSMVYWEALFCLMVVCICLKNWDEYHLPDHPFKQELKCRNLELEDYIYNFYKKAIYLLETSL